MHRIKLASILGQGPAAIVEMSGRLARRAIMLDCSGGPALDDAQIAFLLAEVPPGWDVAELGEVIDAPTLSNALAEQLLGWADRRHGREEEGAGSGDQGAGDAAE